LKIINEKFGNGCLFDEFGFVAGTIEFEVNAAELFQLATGWPDEGYNIDRLKKKSLISDNYFSVIIINKKHWVIEDTDRFCEARPGYLFG
jgi:hypothetical protein